MSIFLAATSIIDHDDKFVRPIDLAIRAATLDAATRRAAEYATQHALRVKPNWTVVHYDDADELPAFNLSTDRDVDWLGGPT